MSNASLNQIQVAQLDFIREAVAILHNIWGHGSKR